MNDNQKLLAKYAVMAATQEGELRGSISGILYWKPDVSPAVQDIINRVCSSLSIAADNLRDLRIQLNKEAGIEP